MHALRINRSFYLGVNLAVTSRRYIYITAMSPSPTMKRKAATAPISPPPTKRSVQSGTTKSAVASFFTPASQKPKSKTTWSERSPSEDSDPTLLVGRYEPDTKETDGAKRTKVAAFDLDSTLIRTKSERQHAKDAADWQWWDADVPGRLRKLYADGYRVVIFSNQGGMKLHFPANYKGPKSAKTKRLGEFKPKCDAILSQLDLPITIYAATEPDIFRKPRIGMWNELCKDYNLSPEDVDLQSSFFVGDAAGRPPYMANGKTIAKDFSCSDRNMAHNIGIPFQTPEEYFLSEDPRPFERTFDLETYPFSRTDANDEEVDVAYTKKNKLDVVLFCGSPGAGKSTFYQTHLKPLGYHRINQDTLKTRDKCLQVAKQHLEQDESIAIDNTNADTDVRKLWVDLANKFDVPIRCIHFKTPMDVCQHNNMVRALNKSMNPESRETLPGMAFSGFASRYKPPQLKEGFQDITEVPFQFRGTEEEYKIWGRYWA